jgi:hypothetical protein
MSFKFVVQKLSERFKFDYREALDFLKTYKRGAGCSFSGNQYERDVWNIVSQTFLNGKQFNTQAVDTLAGSSSGNDIECNFISERDIGIEVKKARTPDWMQCSIKYKNGKWKGSTRGKIPAASREIFNKLLASTTLFGGEIPPFFERKITHDEWCQLKKSGKWSDQYISIPDYTIRDLYQRKGCQYIQISDFGLYRLGPDVCGFGCPEFIIDQQIRIRIKVHKRVAASGFCHLSVTAAAQPRDIRTLKKSPYSLDSFEKLPTLLHKLS